LQRASLAEVVTGQGTIKIIVMRPLPLQVLVSWPPPGNSSHFGVSSHHEFRGGAIYLYMGPHLLRQTWSMTMLDVIMVAIFDHVPPFVGYELTDGTL